MYYNYNDENENTSVPENNETQTPAEETKEFTCSDSADISAVGETEQTVNEEKECQTADKTSNYGNTYYEPWRDPECSEPDDMNRAFSPNYYKTSTAGYSGNVYEKPAKEKKKMSSGAKFAIRAVCLVLACGIISGAAAAGVTSKMLSEADYTVKNQVVLGNTLSGGSTTAQGTTNTSVTPDGSVLSAEQIYDIACQQAVGIQLSATGTNIFGQSTTSESVIGSGFIISEDGYIVTNYHVAEPYLTYGSQGGYDLKVVMYDDSVYDAEVVGYEEQNDIAVLKIAASGLTPVTIGNMSNVDVGDKVYAVGNPLGELTYTMTDGIVSALDRVISTEASTSLNVFQISAAVNSGNSGGPVYNECGEVIGVVDAKYSATGVEGLGFAIPIDDAMNVITELIEHGYVTGKAYFGIKAQSISETAAMYYNMPQGAYVYSVESGSCAETAGLQAGDVIIKLGDEEITSMEDLQAAKYAYSAGDTVEVTVSRAGEERVLTVTFDEEPANTQTQESQSGSQKIFTQR